MSRDTSQGRNQLRSLTTVHQLAKRFRKQGMSRQAAIFAALAQMTTPNPEPQKKEGAPDV